MADYHIYLHSDNTSQAGAKTKAWKKASSGDAPFSSSNTTSWSNRIMKGVSIAQNPDGLVSSAISKGMKAIPAVAAAFAIIKLGDKVATEIIDFRTIASGDYSARHNYNNFKAELGAALRPVKTTIDYFKSEYINRNADEQSKLRLSLYGDSYINGFNGYGV